MRQKTSVRKIGNSTYLLLPPALVEYLDLAEGDETTWIEDREKQHGPYAQFWSTNQKKKSASNDE